MKKKLLSLLLALAMLLTLAACGGTQQGEEAQQGGETEQQGEETTDSGETEEKSFKIGVIQLAQHPALDEACAGFIAGLDESGLKYDVDVQNASGDQAICSTIATKFVNDGVDLILAIATPAAQAAAQATGDIPILVTAVTDPASAGLVASNEAPGGNVSGTSDMNPVDAQAELLTKLVPDAKTVGIMYHSSEDNSILQANMAQEAFEALGLEVSVFTAADTNEVQAVTQSAVGKVDAIYIPTDNLFADTMSTVSMVTVSAGIPVICGEENMVNAGGLATYGISYNQLGKQTAAQAVKILAEGIDVGTLPIEYCDTALALVINEEVAAQLNITIPEDLQ